jgi:hypothetical protein
MRKTAAMLVAAGVACGGLVAIGGPSGAGVVLPDCATAPADAVTFAPLGRYVLPAPPVPTTETRAEVVAYEDSTLYVTNVGAIDVVDVSDPEAPEKTGSLALPGEPTSVAVHDGLVAVSVPAVPKTEPGRVLFFRGATQVGDVTVGALPDMVTFTPDGSLLAVANEGEPNSYGAVDSVDPEGTVSVIVTQPFRTPGALRRSGSPQPVSTIGFGDFNVGQPRNAELSPDVRIVGPGASVAQDLEPEYITVADDGRTAWVSLQENNAIAQVDLRDKTVTEIFPLGYADHSIAGHGIDASDQNSGIVDITTWPVKGMYMPDGIANYAVDGARFVVTANEGDARDWPGISTSAPTNEEPRRAKSVADLTLFPAADDNNKLGRLNVTPLAPATKDPVTGKLTSLYSYGSRSFSIRAVDDDFAVAFDSADQFECITNALVPNNFNASNSNNTKKNRSDDKGPEPEVVVVGEVDGRMLAFVGLERIGGVMVYDISDPGAAVFQQYLATRNFSVAPTATDSGPEGMVFVPADESPTGVPLLAVGNEVSGTVNIFGLVG